MKRDSIFLQYFIFFAYNFSFSFSYYFGRSYWFLLLHTACLFKLRWRFLRHCAMLLPRRYRDGRLCLPCYFISTMTFRRRRPMPQPKIAISSTRSHISIKSEALMIKQCETNYSSFSLHGEFNFLHIFMSSVVFITYFVNASEIIIWPSYFAEFSIKFILKAIFNSYFSCRSINYAGAVRT